MELILLWLAVGIGFGFIGGSITEKKNRGFASGFLLCTVLGCIGLVIAVVLSPVAAAPVAPVGLRAVRCPRCNADQNVPFGAESAECWQCHLDMPLAAPGVQLQGGAAGDAYAAVPLAPPSLKEAPTLAAAKLLFPEGLPSMIKVQVIKPGDPNFGKVGTLDEYRDGLANVRFTALGKHFPYALDELKPN